MITQEKLPLRSLRILNGMSREDLMKATGFSYDTIMRYENDIEDLRGASYKNLEKMAHALGGTVDNTFFKQ